MEAAAFEEIVQVVWPLLVAAAIMFAVIVWRLTDMHETLRSIDASLKALPAVREADRRGEIRRVA